MRTKIYLLTIVFVCSIMTAFAAGPMYVQLHDGGGPRDESTGSGGSTGTTRSVSSEITVLQTPGSKIETVFNSNIGTIDVVIKNSAGIMLYKKSVNTATTYNIDIKILGLPKGTYNISFSDKAGGLVNGDFKVD